MDEKEIETKSLQRNLIGLSCGAIAGLFYALGNALVQYIYRQNRDAELSEDQVILVRSMVQFILIITILACKKMNPWTGSWKMFARLWVMGMTKVISLVFFYRALRVLPLGDATVVLFTNPVFTLFLGIVFLKESRSILNILFGLLSFLGVAIIADPQLFFATEKNTASPLLKANSSLVLNPTPFAANSTLIITQPYSQLASVGFALLGAIMLSLYMVILKYNTTDKVDFRVALFYPSACGLVIPPIVQAAEQHPFVWNQLTYKYWIIMVLSGLSYFAAMFLMAYALYMAEAGPAALVRNAEVIFALIFEVVIVKEIPMLFSLIGVFIILWCTSMIVFNRIFGLEEKICKKCCKPKTKTTYGVFKIEVSSEKEIADEKTKLNPGNGINTTYTRL